MSDLIQQPGKKPLMVDVNTVLGLVVVSIGEESCAMAPDLARKVAAALMRKANALDGTAA